MKTDRIVAGPLERDLADILGLDVTFPAGRGQPRRWHHGAGARIVVLGVSALAVTTSAIVLIERRPGPPAPPSMASIEQGGLSKSALPSPAGKQPDAAADQAPAGRPSGGPEARAAPLATPRDDAEGTQTASAGRRRGATKSGTSEPLDEARSGSLAQPAAAVAAQQGGTDRAVVPGLADRTAVSPPPLTGNAKIGATEGDPVRSTAAAPLPSATATQPGSASESKRITPGSGPVPDIASSADTRAEPRAATLVSRRVRRSLANQGDMDSIRLLRRQ